MAKPTQQSDPKSTGTHLCEGAGALADQGRSLFQWGLPAVLGWLIPGAGHMLLGQVKRGLIIFVAISALFYTGVAVGGTMTVDRQSEPYWFLAQMGSGAHGLVGWYRQDQVYRELLAEPGFVEAAGRLVDRMPNKQMAIDARLAKRGIALTYPEDNIAHAYTGVAGMLNVLCAFDAAMLALMIGAKKRAARLETQSEGGAA
ncbi:MAG: hypothetical protein HN909_04080 [Phycisphaerales bacterium]|nr:hypothetical protein [Phycisphaerales bacterium]MBT7170930.1 hypothetical protein [Phycisphaerales bacterium]